MIEIKLEDDTSIPKGNFAFIEQSTQNEQLFLTFLEMEQTLKLSYEDFLHKLRKAFEEFVLFEEATRRSLSFGDDYSMDIPKFKSTIISEVMNRQVSYKKLACQLCESKMEELGEFIFKWYNHPNEPQDTNLYHKALWHFFNNIYAFGSKSSHAGEVEEKRYKATRLNCLNVLSQFHKFLSCYYGSLASYNSRRIPYGDYYVILTEELQKKGVKLPNNKQLYVKEMYGKTAYYIFSPVDSENMKKSHRKDIEILYKLWNDNAEDPNNILRLVDVVGGSNGDYSYQTYSLPGQPFTISDTLIASMSYEDRIHVVLGLIKGIYSMHTFHPPFYHRNICPEAFFVCKVKGKYKPIISNFELTKDMDSESSYTVLDVVEQAIQQSQQNLIYYAPEIRKGVLNRSGIDWEKADIYSLAQLIIKVLTNHNVESDEELDDRWIDMELSQEQNDILKRMLKKDANLRPGIREVIKCF